MPRSRPPYPPEFRAEAVRLARAEGNSIRGVARDLGISGYIETFYNPQRRHSLIGQLSPAEYERRYGSEPAA